MQKQRKQPTYQTESNTAHNIINVASKLMSMGNRPDSAIPAANVVKFNSELIKRINALKQIEILDIATKAYLYNIQLTDNALPVEAKINAIWTLVKSAGLIDDHVLDDDIPTTVSADDDISAIASDVLEKLLIQ